MANKKKWEWWYNEAEVAAFKQKAHTDGFSVGYDKGFIEGKNYPQNHAEPTRKPTPSERLRAAEKELLLAQTFFNYSVDEQNLLKQLIVARERVNIVENDPDGFFNRNFSVKVGKVNVAVDGK